MFRKWLKGLVREVLDEDTGPELTSSVNLHARSMANKHERLEHAPALADAAAFLARQAIVTSGHPSGRVTKQVTKRDPVIVDPTDPSAIAAAMRK